LGVDLLAVLEKRGAKKKTLAGAKKTPEGETSASHQGFQNLPKRGRGEFASGEKKDLALKGRTSLGSAIKKVAPPPRYSVQGGGLKEGG